MSTGFPNEPGSREPGLDQLIKALTADGYPHELAGRDAALRAFREASRRQSRRRVSLGFQLSRSIRLATSVRLGVSARLGALAAALVVAIAGFTAAAYAKALPAPVQHIAYSVLAPLGVPNSQPTSSVPARSLRKPVRGSSAAAVPSEASPSAASSSCPCPAATSRPAIRGSVLAVTAARTQLPANGYDVFAGELTYQGRPEPGVRLQLLEEAAGTAGWQQVASGVTGGRGRVKLGVPHLTQNAAFRLSGPDGVGSPAIAVTVIPRVLLWRGRTQSGTDRLVAGARFGAAGDIVVLQELSEGTWTTVASETLNAEHRAPFDVPASTAAGHYLRALLQATSAHGASVSNLILEPGTHVGTRAIVLHPATDSTSPDSASTTLAATTTPAADSASPAAATTGLASATTSLPAPSPSPAAASSAAAQPTAPGTVAPGLVASPPVPPIPAAPSPVPAAGPAGPALAPAEAGPLPVVVAPGSGGASPVLLGLVVSGAGAGVLGRRSLMDPAVKRRPRSGPGGGGR